MMSKTVDQIKTLKMAAMSIAREAYGTVVYFISANGYKESAFSKTGRSTANSEYITHKPDKNPASRLKDSFKTIWLSLQDCFSIVLASLLKILVHGTTALCLWLFCVSLIPAAVLITGVLIIANVAHFILNNLIVDWLILSVTVNVSITVLTLLPSLFNHSARALLFESIKGLHSAFRSACTILHTSTIKIFSLLLGSLHLKFCLPTDANTPPLTRKQLVAEQGGRELFNANHQIGKIRDIFQQQKRSALSNIRKIFDNTCTLIVCPLKDTLILTSATIKATYTLPIAVLSPFISCESSEADTFPPLSDLLSPK